MPDTTPSHAASLKKAAANTTPTTLWDQLTGSIRAEIIHRRDNGGLPEHYELSGRVERFVISRRERIWLDVPFTLLTFIVGVPVFSIVGHLDNHAAMHTPWFWIAAGAALLAAAGTFVTSNRIYVQATFPLSPFSREPGSFYLLAWAAMKELRSAAEQQLPQARQMLSAAEQILPGYEELLIELDTLERERDRARGRSLITGGYGTALQDRAEPVREALLEAVVDLTAAARIAFAARPSLLAQVNATAGAQPATVPIDQPRSALTAKAQDALTAGRAQLAAAAQALADQ